MLIIGGSESGKKSVLLNLINHQLYIDQSFLNFLNFLFLINKRELINLSFHRVIILFCSKLELQQIKSS